MLRARAKSFLAAQSTLDGVLFRSIARRDLPECEMVLQPDAEFVRALLRPAQEDRWRSPFIIPLNFDRHTLATKQCPERAAVEGLFATAMPARARRRSASL